MMNIKGLKAGKTAIAAAFGASLMLVGCGGGGGSDADNAPTGSTIVGAKVAGPLDPVQAQVSSAVITPLADSLGGTPLAPVVLCTNAIVNGSVLDIADTVLVTLQSTAPNAGAANPQALAGSLRAMVADIVMLLEGLSGEAQGCLGSDGVTLLQLQSVLTALDGTPLAPLATTLEPVLEQIITTVGSSGAAPAGLQLSTVAGLVSQLNDALQLALSQIPPTAYAAPVVGGALTTVSVALNDVDALLTAALGFNTSATSSALQKLLDHSLVNLLTLVVPLQSLETSAGQSGAITGQIKTASAALATLVGQTVGKVLDPAFSALLGAQADTLTTPLQTLLPTIVSSLQAALNGGASGGTGGPLAGTALAPVVNIVSTVLTQLLGGASGTCPLASIPVLSVLCVKI